MTTNQNRSISIRQNGQVHFHQHNQSQQHRRLPNIMTTKSVPSFKSQPFLVAARHSKPIDDDKGSIIYDSFPDNRPINVNGEEYLVSQEVLQQKKDTELSSLEKDEFFAESLADDHNDFLSSNMTSTLDSCHEMIHKDYHLSSNSTDHTTHSVPCSVTDNAFGNTEDIQFHGTAEGNNNYGFDDFSISTQRSSTHSNDEADIVYFAEPHSEHNSKSINRNMKHGQKSSRKRNSKDNDPRDSYSRIPLSQYTDLLKDKYPKQIHKRSHDITSDTQEEMLNYAGRENMQLFNIGDGFETSNIYVRDETSSCFLGGETCTYRENVENSINLSNQDPFKRAVNDDNTFAFSTEGDNHYKSHRIQSDIPEDKRTFEKRHTSTNKKSAMPRFQQRTAISRSKSLNDRKADDWREKSHGLHVQNPSLSGSLKELSHLNIDVSQKLVDGEHVFEVTNGSPEIQVMVNALTPVLSRRNRSGRRSIKRRNSTNRSCIAEEHEEEGDQQKSTKYDNSSNDFIAACYDQNASYSESKRNTIYANDTAGQSERPKARSKRRENLYQISDEIKKISQPTNQHGSDPSRNEHSRTISPIQSCSDFHGMPRLTAVEDKEISNEETFINPNFSNTWHGYGMNRIDTKYRPAPRMGIGMVLVDTTKFQNGAIDTQHHRSKYHRKMSAPENKSLFSDTSYPNSTSSPSSSPGAITRSPSSAFSPLSTPYYLQTFTLPVISRTLLDAMHKRYCAHQYNRNNASILQPFSMLRIDPTSSHGGAPITALRVKPKAPHQHEVAQLPSPPGTMEVGKAQKAHESISHNEANGIKETLKTSKTLIPSVSDTDSSEASASNFATDNQQSLSPKEFHHSLNSKTNDHVLSNQSSSVHQTQYSSKQKQQHQRRQQQYQTDHFQRQKGGEVSFHSQIHMHRELPGSLDTISQRFSSDPKSVKSDGSASDDSPPTSSSQIPARIARAGVSKHIAMTTTMALHDEDTQEVLSPSSIGSQFSDSSGTTPSSSPRLDVSRCTSIL